MFDIKGKVAIVTGGASGIGLATVEALLRKGAKVVMSDIDMIKLHEESTRLCVDYFDDITYCVTDVSKEEQVADLIKFAVDTYGRLDIMVANAGVLMTGSHLEDSTKFQKVVDVNLMGVYYSDKHAITQFLAQGGGGVVINTSSAAGIKGQAGYPLYSMTKFGVRGLTKALAIEHAKDGIRVSSIHPAGVQTPMTTAGMDEATIQYMLEAAKKVQPLGFAKPEEIAHAIIFNIENPQMTGTELIIDGGFTSL